MDSPSPFHPFAFFRQSEGPFTGSGKLLRSAQRKALRKMDPHLSHHL